MRPQSAPAHRVSGPIPLPTEKEVVTILRAVHKYKDSREQFEMRTHKRLIDILRPSNKTVEALQGLELPAGVEIEDQALISQFHGTARSCWRDAPSTNNQRRRKAMQKCIVGKKIGMTQIFDEAGKVIPVTVVEAGPCVVVQKKTVENDGYESVQMGFGDMFAEESEQAHAGSLCKSGCRLQKSAQRVPT